MTAQQGHSLAFQYLSELVTQGMVNVRAALASAPAQPLAWINEDELPEGYPYEAMFPYSKVDMVRMFPVYGPHVPAQPVATTLPNPGSPEASAMIDALLAEYQYPSNPKNSARAGYEAARRMLASAHGDRSSLLEAVKQRVEAMSEGEFADKMEKASRLTGERESAQPVAEECVSAAIQFAIRNDSPKEFLNAWLHGDWEVIRREWPEAPTEVFSAQAAPKVPDLTPEQIDALDTQMLHVMAPRGRESVREFARDLLRAAAAPQPATSEQHVISAFLERTGQYVTNDASREAAIADAISEQRKPLTQAAADVLAERQRQISAEGWTPEHDDEHSSGEMARAAACYANPDLPYVLNGTVGLGWPWDLSWWKPTDQRRNLVKAGALILAEIERLDRAGIRSTGGEQS